MGRVERFVAEDSDEIVWLRLNRFKSVKLCEVVLKEKLEEKAEKKIDENLIHRKAIGLSSAIESAIGYWKSRTDNINCKVLSRYYALLQMTIAEQVSAISNDDDLSTIQRHTEQGHGLGTISNPEDSFPNNYCAFILKAGHFHSYAKFLGYDTKGFDFERRPKDFKKIDTKEQLVPLNDLFRRIPELQPVIWEHLGEHQLSFHIGHASKNLAIERERAEKHMARTGKFTLLAPETQKEKITYIAIYPEKNAITLDYIRSLNWPFTEIKEADDKSTRTRYFIGEFRHSTDDYWHTYLSLYKSAYCGTSYIIPLLDTITDPIALNLMLLYSLSIIVRYMPDLWYKINTGDLNHIGSLIDYYLSVFDHVMPLKMLEKITEKRIKIDMPGSLFAPV